MRRLLRIFKIARVFARYRLDTFFEQVSLHWYARLLLKLMLWRYFIPVGPRSQGERLRLALEELGPIFIKFGQMLSTRRDLLSDDLALELKKLQDQVPPFASAYSQQLIEEALNAPVEELFAEFNAEPMASASVAQVHEALLYNGEEVVIKVIRPGIAKTIKKDMALLYTLARLVEALWAEGRRLKPVEVVADYENTIFDELDLRKEAANGSQIRRNFENSPLLYVPEIYWDLTRQNVLVMERIHGIPVADIEQLKAQNTDMKKLAEQGVEIFFTQVFRDSFFHADMHPGNIFVSRENPSSPQYIAVDFGIVGSLSPEDQSYLARNFLAFFQRDYRQVAQLHIDSGWVPADTNVQSFETAIRSVCEPIFEKPLKDISFGMVLMGLFQTARRFNMEVQPQLVLLQKTLLNIEGLGRQLYPELDLWQTGQPFLERWMKERMGPKAAYRSIKQQAPDWLDKMPHLPQMAYDALNQLKNMDDTRRRDMLAMSVARQELQQKSSHQWRWVGVVCLIVAAGLSLDDPLLAFQELPAISWLLGGVGAVLLLRH
ncbi:ubiquinone biosynthesis regulatory protein kinase UbiB [Amphritea sp. 2_MG-2023]|uniref:ubiquinone biosynthesis regulatory protein kinase UbiB n=1 Tax=Amphritea TaxID=515417 RepID=UPI001C07D7A4|nr:ubiquinone biosynthesis regulatory protein kinase UbiB [Amphritea sp. 2_MG-2023]MBU2967742.1 ubiquinone biosynthesis regulatory protein kinase UbiB [Amphritea atlantica]MDO6416940.1 ubiquinone biosynthesis regulatory protein kinase UbiB [Amphritea sp. 2_MG-2023]